MEDSSPWATSPVVSVSSLPNDADIWRTPAPPVQPPSATLQDLKSDVDEGTDATAPLERKSVEIEGEKRNEEEIARLHIDDSLQQAKDILTEVTVSPETPLAEQDIPAVQPLFVNSIGFDQDDDDFGDDDFAAAPAPTGNVDDDFGDFGDFDDAQEAVAGGFDDAAALDGDASFQPSEIVDEPEPLGDSPWGQPIRPLQLDPLPSRQDLADQIQSIMLSIFDKSHEGTLTDEPIRQVAGLNQILTTESSRETYAQLTTPPLFKPLDWTRSRARREHLVALGIPVNLDEVDSHRLRALPPLRITTANASTTKRTQSLDSKSPERNGNAAAGPSRLRGEMRERSKTKDESSLGERPEWNRAKSERLLEYREDQLSLVPPKYLKRMQEDLVEACSTASSLLAWLRQLEEIRKDDNKRKNEQIAEMISKAQRLKASESSNTGGGLFRKGSQKRHSSSGYNTPPNRTGSPAVR